MSEPVRFPLIPGKANGDGTVPWKEVEFLFTVRAAKDLEEVAGTSPYLLSLRGQSVKATVLMVLFGLRHADAAMNESRAVALLDKYLKGGGKLKPLNEALVKAMNESGVYGDPDTPEAPEPLEDKDEGDPQPDPSKSQTTTS